MKTIKNISELDNLSQLERARLYIPEDITTKLPIKDCKEPIIELASFLEKQKTPAVFAPVPTATTYPMYLRVGTATQLSQAIKDLGNQSNQTLTLKITETFRPLTVQRQLFTEIKTEIAEREKLTGQALWQRVTQFIADPDLCPPHSTGGALDCTIVDMTTGQELDMGTSINSIDDRAYTWHSDLSSTAQKNRLILFQVMTSAGFVNLASEWWHYSYGDQYWAIFTGLPAAIYASVPQL